MEKIATMVASLLAAAPICLGVLFVAFVIYFIIRGILCFDHDIGCDVKYYDEEKGITWKERNDYWKGNCEYCGTPRKVYRRTCPGCGNRYHRPGTDPDDY